MNEFIRQAESQLLEERGATGLSTLPGRITGRKPN